MIREPLIFEISGKGKRAFSLPELDVPSREDILQGLPVRENIEGFPQVSEVEIIRHFTRLSKANYCVDEGFYPLGSCTMKYNPKINEKIAAISEFVLSHPYAPFDLVQGNLGILKTTEELMNEITGMDAFSFLPAAGAQGELVGMMLIRAYLEERGNPRKIVLIPDSAHGTNPSSAHICGYNIQEIESNEKGTIDISSLEQNMTEDVAALMITNPNTLGVFEADIKKISEIVHAKGGFVYMDGANMNALVGICRPGDMDVDVIHLNLHKTFSTPHGGGGPGSGPVGVKRELEPYLPLPTIKKSEDKYILDFDRPKSIGRVRSFFGNFLVVVKAMVYILSLGPRGLKEVSEIAVLNSNYVRKSLEKDYFLKYTTPTLHECVFSDKFQKKHGVQNIDIAKRLIDFGVHPPTMSFPLIVQGALMTEPTETESKRDLDLFIDAMKQISKEAKENPEIVKSAPHSSYVRRLDETSAARSPVLRWVEKK
ncbi:MAG: aminomethyl-transferring glycine dehydrogenase subunit GcvPB [Candidatus Aminicenantes bacterium]|nr:aminomethyl-transferring glycine dehydrogenase subunit GcvPB [Candidatus Aminicenantes bacterium]MBL7082370.1 aminomethyl-transferring glycine dehydrogenase subunit GcvPB [Candidatus Aminicenantes bacterium]